MGGWDGEESGITQRPEERESENDSGPPDFGKEPALLIHLTSAAADLGLILLDFYHLPLYAHRGEKNQKSSIANSSQ